MVRAYVKRASSHQADPSLSHVSNFPVTHTYIDERGFPANLLLPSKPLEWRRSVPIAPDPARYPTKEAQRAYCRLQSVKYT